MTTHNVLTLSQLTGRLSSVLHDAFVESLWVQAEISELNVRKGHCYMELVEKDDTGRNFAAKIRATCWASVYTSLSAYFTRETGQSLAVGMKVLLAVEVNFHPVFGLSLTVVDIEPSFTVGELLRQRRLTIERLKQEGVFDMNRMHSIPLLPRRIAVISSDTAAGYGDFCHQLRHNPRSFSFDITLFPALMQGDKAAASIVEALDLVAERLSDFDLVVIIRGGGATTDLTCFDAYDLAAHCAQFPLPIVAGIGHLRDTSVLDMVVHTSLKTPTAVAEFLLQAFLLQDDMLVQFGRRVSQALKQRLLQQNHTVEQLQLRVFSLMHRHLLGEKNKLDLAEKTIELHSPQRILKQGYSLTHVAGRVLTSADEVKPGDRLVTEFADGTITSIVE